MNYLTAARSLRGGALACSGLICLATLSGCGSSDDDSAPPPEMPPIPAAQVAPAIITQPQVQSVQAGRAAAYSVVVDGGVSRTYQWSRNGVAIAGATTTSYTTPAATLRDSGDVLRVSIRNDAGTVTSDAALLLVEGIGVRTLAGGAIDPTLSRVDGAGKEARFLTAGSMALDGTGNLLVADTQMSVLRKVTPSGVVTTVGPGPVPSARLNSPRDIAIGAGGAVYVTEGNNPEGAVMLRKIGTDGTTTTVLLPADPADPVAGDGAALPVRYTAVAADLAGNVFIASEVGRSGEPSCSSCVTRAVVRKLAPDGKLTVLQEAVGATGTVNRVSNMTVDKAGNLYAQTGEGIVRIGPDGSLVTVLRNDLAGIGAMTVDGAGNLYFATVPFSGRPSTWPIGAIGKLTPQGVVSVAADPNGGDARFQSDAWIANPRGIAFDAAGALYVSGDGRVLKLVLP